MMLVTILNSTEDIYGATLAKIIDCTYSHVVKILELMRRADLIQYERRGRLKLLTLTKRGREVAKGIDNVRSILSRG